MLNRGSRAQAAIIIFDVLISNVITRLIADTMSRVMVDALMVTVLKMGGGHWT